MIALLSIKPVFAERIFSGSKLFEYRKCVFRRPVTRVLVYASAPISMIVGEFEVEELVYDDLELLWRKTKDHSGITEDYFYAYFGNKNKGYAIKVKNVCRYNPPIPLQDLYSSPPPQSFAYLTSPPSPKSELSSKRLSCCLTSSACRNVTGSVTCK